MKKNEETFFAAITRQILVGKKSLSPYRQVDVQIDRETDTDDSERKKKTGTYKDGTMWRDISKEKDNTY